MAMAVDPFDVDTGRGVADSWAARSGPSPRALPPIVLCLPTLFGAATFAVPASTAVRCGEEVAGR